MNGVLPYTLRRLRRGWTSGELLILSAALAVAVGTSAAVGFFTDRVRNAIRYQSGEALGGDLMATARSAVPADYVAAVRATGARATNVTSLPSVVFRGETSALASVKAAGDGYPLRGTLRIADEAFGEERAAAGLPAPGEAWVDSRLFGELRLAIGDTVEVGATTLRVTQVLTFEPDRGGGFMDLAPRLLMHDSSLEASELAVPGARAQYTLLIAGEPDVLDAVRALNEPPTVRLRGPEDARPELRRALERADLFLDLAVLASLLLAAAAVAVSARSYGRRLRDEVALLKCLGASGNFVVAAITLSLLGVALVAGAAGVAVGYGAQAVVVELMRELIQVSLPPAALAPAVSAVLLGLLLLCGFALPPCLDARRTPPVRVFQRDVAASGATRSIAAIACLAIGCMLWLQTRDVMLAGIVLGGAVVVMGILAALAALLVRTLAPLRRAVAPTRRGWAWRFGLGNVSRRAGATVAQVVALGLGLMALLLLGVSRQDLLESWQARLSPGTPNQFLINVQPAQVEPLREFLGARGYGDAKLWPMARARLVGLNRESVTAETFDDPETQRWINREFNLSWTDELGDDNRVIDGEWWGAAGRGKPWLSADRYAIERLGLKIGDSMTVLIADREITLEVRNFREVDWDSFRPNFFLLVPTGVLDGSDGAPAAPATYLTSFYLPPEKRALLRELVGAFPNITALDLESMMNQVRSIMDRITGAVEFIFLFTLAAGLTVLLAAIEATRDERVREIGLLRALGASRSVVTRGLLAEYATLGLLAGTVAAIAAQGLTWALAEQVFDIRYELKPAYWLYGAGAGAFVVTLLGWLALRGTLDTPPHTVLRGGS